MSRFHTILFALVVAITLPLSLRADKGVAPAPDVEPVVEAPSGADIPERMPGQAEIPPWYAVGRIGYFDLEGDEELEDGIVVEGGIGYDWTDTWGLEALILIAPSLDKSDSPSAAGLDFSSASAFGVALDGLFHFTRIDRLDPYIAAGVGFMAYSQGLADDNKMDLLVRGGGGAMWHFNDEWAVRADYRAILAGYGESPNANSIVSFGVSWNWGANVPADYVITGPLDSDGDGLTDAEEEQIGTDPQNPDTDGDDLTDYQEVRQYGTNPLEKDTDLDLLRDGEEVLSYKTDPLVPDTDAGGVCDGHEVLEDGTDPLNGADDLLLFRLNIEFETDKADLKAKYDRDLDVIGKVMTRYPASTAKIEGHADKRKTSAKAYNEKLSERRGQSVLKYLQTKWHIPASRLTAKGYGFNRPIAPNDPASGNVKNRRVDVYVDKNAEEPALPATLGDAPVLSPAEGPVPATAEPAENTSPAGAR